MSMLVIMKIGILKGIKQERYKYFNGERCIFTFMKSFKLKTIFFTCLLLRNVREGCINKLYVPKALHFNSCYVFAVAAPTVSTKEWQDNLGKESLYRRLPRD